ncbi:UB2L5 enzyme, partial [Calonectris borealis]|nr:UB2L5 enzyme [Calonectris borealis]
RPVTRPPQELEEARRWGGARELRPLEGDVLRWGGLLLPNNPPYNMGAFRFELTFSPHHPLVPPRATLRTSIYHPGVDPDGRVCQPLTSAQRWMPTTRAVQGGHHGDRGGTAGGGARPDPPVVPAVLQDLLLLLDSPDPQRVLRQDLARELQDQPEVFWRRAEEHTRCHAETRPPDPRGP